MRSGARHWVFFSKKLCILRTSFVEGSWGLC
jgi:hypothetical protein